MRSRPRWRRETMYFWILIIDTRLTQPRFCACSNPVSGFSSANSIVCLVFNDLRWVVVVCFGDIVGIVDHHWLKFFLTEVKLYPTTTIRKPQTINTKNTTTKHLCIVFPNFSYDTMAMLFSLGGFIVFYATLNNISVISRRSVLLLEETGVPGENHWPVASHWQNLSHIMLWTLCVVCVDFDSSVVLDKWWLHLHDLIDIFMMNKIQFLNNIIIIKTTVLLPQA